MNAESLDNGGVVLFFPLPFPLLGKINELYLESFCFLGGM